MNRYDSDRALIDQLDAWVLLRGPRTIKKKTPNGRTLERLTQTNPERDQYSYYHATKGWRTRRTMGKTDAELRG